MFSGLLDKVLSKSVAQVKITAVNVKFLGQMHGLNGVSVRGGTFFYELPFQNKIGGDLLPDQLKGPKMTIGQIIVKEPFHLIEVTPNLPKEVEYLEKTSFRLKLDAPNLAYEGPLSIEIVSDSRDSISINVQKMALSRNGKSIDIDDSSMVLPMHKNQIFRRSIQLYKIMAYGEMLNGIEISRPFEIVSTEPKLPLLLDKKDSYILNMYIKSPAFNYAGNIDITLR